MDPRVQRRGRDAEDRAVSFLEAQGFRILARNLRTKSGEIDIVAHEGPTLVMVEVRYRHEHVVGAWRSLSTRKRRSLLRAGHEARARLRIPRSLPLRFDVVLIASGARLLHLRGALPRSAPHRR